MLFICCCNLTNVSYVKTQSRFDIVAVAETKVSSLRLESDSKVMAIAYGDWDAESYISSSSSRGRSEQDQVPLIDLYPNIDWNTFSSRTSFKRKCEAVLELVGNGQHCPYLGFSAVGVDVY